MRKPSPAAAPSVPSRTERRDTRSCVTGEGAESGPMGARMRFVPVLPEFIIQMEVPRPGIFSGFVALLQTGIRLQPPSSVTLPPYFARREPVARRRSDSHWPRTQEQGIIAMDHRIASARPLGRALAVTVAGAFIALLAGPAAA